MRTGWTLFVGLMVVGLLAGCGAAAAPTEETPSAAYVSAHLATDYEGALDAQSQLVLGMLRLEETPLALTADQARTLLPLWRALQAGTFTDNAEANAALAHIEGVLTAEQIEAVARMRLTVEDRRAWAGEHGIQAGPLGAEGTPGAVRSFGGEQGGEGPAMPGAGFGAADAGGEIPPEIATRRAEFAAMSEEERQALRATMEAGGSRRLGGTAGAQPLRADPLLASLIALLEERAAQASAATPAAATAPPAPTATATPAAAPSATPVATPIPTLTPTATPPQPSVQAQAADQPVVAATAQVSGASAAGATGARFVEIERIPDTDPAPPLTILVDGIQILDNGYYRMTGRVRNDGDVTYERAGVHASFRDSHGVGHGPIDVYVPCPYLEPGASCPFVLEIYPREYVAYHLHPLGQPLGVFYVWRAPAALAVTSVRVSDDGAGHVRVQGTVVNENACGVTHATVTGTLYDGDGRVASVASITVVGDLAPGASAAFDLRIPSVPYARYDVQAQGTQLNAT